MPSDVHGGRGRSAISKYRVKLGNKDLYASSKMMDCVEWIRKHSSRGRLRLIPPNYPHK